jgi:hypothetical protein
LLPSGAALLKKGKSPPHVIRSPSQFNGVSVVTKANVYFDGNVVSYTILLPDGVKKTVGPDPARLVPFQHRRPGAHGDRGRHVPSFSTAEPSSASYVGGLLFRRTQEERLPHRG